MSVKIDSHLNTFNTLALRFQDEAFTLAYYLTGDEMCAEQATQAAFTRLYQRAGVRLETFRLETLRRVLDACQGSGWFARVSGRKGGLNDWSRKLLALPVSARSAAVLVDVLGLGYDEAAQVLDCSPKQAGRLLAQARAALAKD